MAFGLRWPANRPGLLSALWPRVPRQVRMPWRRLQALGRARLRHDERRGGLASAGPRQLRRIQQAQHKHRDVMNTRALRTSCHQHLWSSGDDVSLTR